MMNGQYWPEGDEVYHAELTVPILLVHGMYDKFVQIQEDQRMAEVNNLVLPVFYLVVKTFMTKFIQIYNKIMTSL